MAVSPTSTGSLARVAYAEVAFGLANVAVGLCLYVRRRDMFPVRARHIALVAASVITSTCENYALMYITFNGLYCTWLRVVSHILSASRITNVMLRYFRLYALFSRAREGLRLQQSEKWTFGLVQRPTKKAFTWLQRFSSDSFVLKMWIGLSLAYPLVLLPAFGALSGVESLSTGDQFCSAIQPGRFLAVATSSLLGVEALTILIALRRLNDNYGIKQELFAYVAMSVSYFAVLYAIPENAISPIETELVEWTVFQLFVFITLYYPVYLSYREQRRRQKRLNIDVDQQGLEITFEQVLNDDQYAEFRTSFESHLVREFSMENLIFYKVTRQFEAMVGGMSDTDAAVAALQILMEFVRDDASFQVNLPEAIRTNVIRELDACFESLPNACDAYIRDSRANKAKKVLASEVGYEGVLFTDEQSQQPSLFEERSCTAVEMSTNTTLSRSVVPRSPRPSSVASHRKTATADTDVRPYQNDSERKAEGNEPNRLSSGNRLEAQATDIDMTTSSSSNLLDCRSKKHSLSIDEKASQPDSRRNSPGTTQDASKNFRTDSKFEVIVEEPVHLDLKSSRASSTHSVDLDASLIPIQRPRTNIFSEARRSIVRLLETDSFARWRSEQRKLMRKQPKSVS